MEASLNNLKKVISKSRIKDKRKHVEVIQQVSSLLVATTADDTQKKLIKHLRQPLVPIFSAYPLPALQFASALFRHIYHERVLTALGNQLLEEKRRWEDVLTSLLSGILDFLDECEPDKNRSISAKDTIADALYPTLCDICFSLTAPMQSVDLRCTAYTLLSDSAASCATNQLKLRDKAVLGGERLGSMIWRTKDYLALESLLTLFAHILPSAKDSQSGQAKRAAYMKAVFLSPQQSEHASVGQTITKLLERVPSNEWEETSRKIVDALALAYITFPQPFSVDKVNACGETKQCDKLYIDDKAFLFNVLIGDEHCEALEIRYDTTRKIEVTPGQAEAAIVDIRVKTPPAISKAYVKSAETSQLRISFALSNADVERFYSAIRSRGLVRLLKDVPPKLSLARSPAILDFDSEGRPVKELSQSERIENVEKFYHTNQSSDDLSVATPQEDAPEQVSATLAVVSSAPNGGRTTVQAKQIDSKTQEAAMPVTAKTFEAAPESPPKTQLTSKVLAAQNKTTKSTQKATSDTTAVPSLAQVPTAIVSKLVKPLGRTRSKKMRDDIFGASDEELSEVSDVDQAPSVWKAAHSARTIEETTRRQKHSSKAVASVVRSGATRRILDSDDEETGHCDPADPGATDRRRTGNNKTRIAPPSPECSDDEGLRPTEKSFVTPPRSQLDSMAAPLTPTKPPAGRSLQPQDVSSPDTGILEAMPSDAGKKLSRGDEQASNGLNAVTQTPAGPTAGVSANARASNNARKSDSRVRDNDTVPLASRGVLVERTANTDENTRRAAESRSASKLPAKVIPVRTSIELDGHNVNSSSPVPILKPERTSVKAKLRKKGQTPTEDKKAAHVKTSKRKRAPMDEDPVLPDTGLVQETAEPPAKKFRGEKRQGSSLRTRRTDSRILRPHTTAAARTTQRYRAKKDKTSSPLSKTGVIDYDELPGNPVASDARSHTPPASKPPRHGRKGDSGHNAAGVSARSTRTTKANVKEERSHASGTALPADLDFVSANGNALYTEDLEDEEEVTTLLTKPSKPSVTVVERPVVEALKASAASSASGMNPFVSTTPTAKEAEGVGEKRKVKSEGKKKSNKMPWLAATKETGEDGVGKLPDSDAQECLTAAGMSAEHRLEVAAKKQNRLPEVDKAKNDDRKHGVQPTKNSETPRASVARAPVTTPHIETIDLTHDDTPVRHRDAPLPLLKRQSSPLLQIDPEHTLVDPPQFSTSTPFRKPEAAAGAGSTAKSARCVTFAPNVEERPSSPSPLGREPYAKAARPTTLMPHSTKAEEQKASVKTKLPSHTRVDIKGKIMNSPGKQRSTPHKNHANVDDIVDVLEELQQAILHRITQRFEGVREEVRFGRNTLLSEAAEDLLHMRNESVTHFNHLIDLEAEYAKLGRTLADGYEQLLREGQDIRSELARMVGDHDRGSMIQRMPVDLATVPACFRPSN